MSLFCCDAAVEDAANQDQELLVPLTRLHFAGSRVAEDQVDELDEVLCLQEYHVLPFTQLGPSVEELVDGQAEVTSTLNFLRSLMFQVDHVRGMVRLRWLHLTGLPSVGSLPPNVGPPKCLCSGVPP